MAIDQLQFSQTSLFLSPCQQGARLTQVGCVSQQQEAFAVPAHLACHVAEAPVGTEYFPVLPGNPRPRSEPGDTGYSADYFYIEVFFECLCRFQFCKHGGGSAVKSAVS